MVSKFLMLLAINLILACNARNQDSDLETLHGRLDASGQKEAAAEVRVFGKTIKGNTVKVHVVDMVHLGPADFYAKVNDTIRLINAQNDAVILDEGQSCKDKTLAVNIANFSPRFFPTPEQADISINAADLSPANLQKYFTFLRRNLPQMKAAGFVAEVNCANSSRGVSTNSEVLTDPYCSEASRADGLTCQSERFDYTLGKKRLSGDLGRSTAPPEDQLLSNLLLSVLFGNLRGSAFAVWLDSDPSGQLLAAILDDYTIYQVRERWVMAHVMRLALMGETNIVVPWGAYHSPHFYEDLTAIGFKQQSSESFTFASCTFARRGRRLAGALREECR